MDKIVHILVALEAMMPVSGWRQIEGERESKVML